MKLGSSGAELEVLEYSLELLMLDAEHGPDTE